MKENDYSIDIGTECMGMPTTGMMSDEGSFNDNQREVDRPKQRSILDPIDALGHGAHRT